MDEFSDMCNKWELWEPEDKSSKNPIRTYWWRINEEEEKVGEEENEEWWEKERMGYDEETETGQPDFSWDKSVIDSISGGRNDNRMNTGGGEESESDENAERGGDREKNQN
jgi:hypothetical protein